MPRHSQYSLRIAGPVRMPLCWAVPYSASGPVKVVPVAEGYGHGGKRPKPTLTPLVQPPSGASAVCQCQWAIGAFQIEALAAPASEPASHLILSTKRRTLRLVKEWPTWPPARHGPGELAIRLTTRFGDHKVEHSEPVRPAAANLGAASVLRRSSATISDGLRARQARPH